MKITDTRYVSKLSPAELIGLCHLVLSRLDVDFGAVEVNERGSFAPETVALVGGHRGGDVERSAKVMCAEIMESWLRGGSVGEVEAGAVTIPQVRRMLDLVRSDATGTDLAEKSLVIGYKVRSVEVCDGNCAGVTFLKRVSHCKFELSEHRLSTLCDYISVVYVATNIALFSLEPGNDGVVIPKDNVLVGCDGTLYIMGAREYSDDALSCNTSRVLDLFSEWVLSTPSASLTITENARVGLLTAKLEKCKGMAEVCEVLVGTVNDYVSRECGAPCSLAATVTFSV